MIINADNLSKWQSPFSVYAFTYLRHSHLPLSWSRGPGFLQLIKQIKSVSEKYFQFYPSKTQEYSISYPFFLSSTQSLFNRLTISLRWWFSPFVLEMIHSYISKSNFISSPLHDGFWYHYN